MPKHEALKKEIPHLHFTPEGYASDGSEDFLNQLLEFLVTSGFRPQELMFSGFDGTKVTKGESVPRHLAIFAMNEAGWRQAIKYKETTPAEYATGWDTPCLGLYDKNQLVHVYHHEFDAETINDVRTEPINIKPGRLLADVPPEEPIEEAIVHKDYPDASPTDALVGLVFINEPI